MYYIEYDPIDGRLLQIEKNPIEGFSPNWTYYVTSATKINFGDYYVSEGVLTEKLDYDPNLELISGVLPLTSLPDNFKGKISVSVGYGGVVERESMSLDNSEDLELTSAGTYKITMYNMTPYKDYTGDLVIV